MKGNYLGELEELVLLTIGVLQPQAYGVAIKDAIKAKIDRQINISAVHTVMHRLESKGLVTSDFGESTPERGGKRKRYFQVTTEGSNALKLMKESRERLWSELPAYVLKSN